MAYIAETLEVASNALLQLGQNGQTGAMTNSGRIEIGYEGGALGLGAQLLIAGAFTVAFGKAFPAQTRVPGFASIARWAISTPR